MEAAALFPTPPPRPSTATDPSPESRPVADVREMKILIVDDAPFNIALLERLLADWGFEQVRSTTDSSSVEALMGSWQPDLLMLDLQMPAPDGFELLRRLDGRREGVLATPIIVLTADESMESRRRALALGATDFLQKPFDFEEVCLRARNMLRARQLELQLEQQNSDLEERVAERSVALERSHLEMLRHLARVAEYRDQDTHHHTERVGRTAAMLGAELGLEEARVQLLRRAAELHDIGKVAIPDRILLKPGRLTPEEFDIVKTHTTAGAEILAGGSSAYLRLAATIAVSHHERWDGGGYPHGLAGRDIPLESRLVSVADVFDALTHARPYKDAMPVAEALSVMRADAGTAFDPLVMAAFERLDHAALAADE